MIRNNLNVRFHWFRLETLSYYCDIVMIMYKIFVQYTDQYTVCLNLTFLNILWVFHMRLTQPLSLVSIRFWLNYKMSLGWQTALYIRFLSLFLTNSDIENIMRSKHLINKIKDHINFYAWPKTYFMRWDTEFFCWLIKKFQMLQYCILYNINWNT